METISILDLVKLASSKDLSLELMFIDNGIHIQLNDNMGSIYSTYSTTSLLEVMFNIERFIVNYKEENNYIDNLVKEITCSIE